MGEALELYMKILIAIFILSICIGCEQEQEENNTVRIERLGVVMEKTAPKEVIVGDQYEVTTKIYEKK